MRIIGVDFSGAKSDQNTWLTEGVLGDNVLTIESCRPISRTALTNELAGLSEPAVVAMDFPFSVPVSFANHWQQVDVLAAGWEMPDLWRAAADLRWETFIELRATLRLDDFNGEPRRPCDPPESKSPLHTARPNMVPMTFRGMQLLNRLWHRYEDGGINRPLRILPLHLDPETDSITLLEVMPGATVRSLAGEGFHNRYKGGENWVNTRLKILDKLPEQARKWGLRLSGITERIELCLGNDDAMDAIIAAITAALWSIGVPARRDPAGCANTELVGWMYVPQRANQ